SSPLRTTRRQTAPSAKQWSTRTFPRRGNVAGSSDRPPRTEAVMPFALNPERLFPPRRRGRGRRGADRTDARPVVWTPSRLGPRSTVPASFPILARRVLVTLQVLWGGVSRRPAGWTQDAFHNENNNSVIIQLDFGSTSMLITGDLQEDGMDKLVERWGNSGLLDVDIYEVGHHGSHNATTHELLDAMTPKVSLISVGPSEERHGFTAWQHGHPREA